MTINLEERIKEILRFASVPEWDGEEGTVPVKKETLDKAVKYIEPLKAMVLKLRGVDLDDNYLRIDACPNGSIDLDWEYRGKYTFLANVPVEGKIANFYGDFKGYEGKEPIEGNFSLNE